MFDEFFDKCALEDEVQTSPEFNDKIKEKLSKKLHTPASVKEDNLMKHINIAKTVISAAAVAALGAVSMIGASADNISELTYTPADGKDLGSVAFQVSSEDGTLSEVGTVNLDDFNVKEVDDAVIRYVDADGNSATKISKDFEVNYRAVTLTSDSGANDILGNLIIGDKVIELTRDNLEVVEEFDYTLQDGVTNRLALAKPKGFDNVALVIPADE